MKYRVLRLCILASLVFGAFLLCHGEEASRIDWNREAEGNTYNLPSASIIKVNKWNYWTRLFGLSWESNKNTVRPASTDLAYSDVRFLGSKFRSVFYYWGVSNNEYVIEGNICRVGTDAYGVRLDGETDFAALERSGSVEYIEIDRAISPAESERIAECFPNLRIVNMCVISEASVMAHLANASPVTYIHWGFLFDSVSPFTITESRGHEFVLKMLVSRYSEWCLEFAKLLGANCKLDHYCAVGNSALAKLGTTAMQHVRGLWYIGAAGADAAEGIESIAEHLESLVIDSFGGEAMRCEKGVFGARLRYFHGEVAGSEDIESQLIACAANEGVFKRMVRKSQLRYCALLSHPTEWGVLREFNGVVQFTDSGLYGSEMFGDSYPDTLIIRNTSSLDLRSKEDVLWLCSRAVEINATQVVFASRDLVKHLTPSRVRRLCLAWVHDPNAGQFWPKVDSSFFSTFLATIRPAGGFQNLVILAQDGTVRTDGLVVPGEGEVHQLVPIRYHWIGDLFRRSDYLQGAHLMKTEASVRVLSVPGITNSGVRAHLRRK